MPNKTLTARAKLDTSGFEAGVKRISNLLNKINNIDTANANLSFESAANDAQKMAHYMAEGDRAAKRLAANAGDGARREYTAWWQVELMKRDAREEEQRRLEKLVKTTERLANKQRGVTREVDNTNKKLTKSKFGVGNIIERFAKWASVAWHVYWGLQMIGKALSTSDVITSAENKLNYVNATALGDSGYTTDSAGNEVYSQVTRDATSLGMDKMYVAAQKSRMGYSDMMTNVSKSMTLASGAFDDNMDNAIRFQEIMAKAYGISGASAAEMSSSMYQMIQGLSSGVLQGDELRSVREGASLAYQKIEEFAQGIYGAETNLKDLASEGKITSDIVVAAVLDAGNEIDGAFEKTNVTFGQTWTNIKNMALRAFQPVLQKLNEVLNKLYDTGAFEAFGNALQFVASIAMGLVSIVGLLVDNWNWLKYIFYAVAVYLGYLAAMFIAAKWASITSAVASFFAWSAALWPFYLIIGVIALVIFALGKLGVSFSDVCGFIVGLLFWIGSVLLNIVFGVINAIIQAVWSKFVAPIANIIDWFVNAFNGAFDGVGGAFLNMLGQMLSGLIGIVKPFTAILDTIFGWDLNDSIEKAQASMKSWGLKEGATASNVAATVPQFKRIDNTDAFNAGFDYGSSFGGSVLGDGIPDLTDPALALNTTTPTQEEMLAGINDTADNTGKISDSLDLTEEDLSYLRDLANREWVERTTNKTIHVDMNNTNTINNQGDLDGWVEAMGKAIYELIDSEPDGVYANG